MKNIVLKDIEYEIIDNYGDCINIEEIEYLYTSYFESFDYICGDYSYDKLRLKGFYDGTNKKCTDINNIKGYDEYIEKLCSYHAKHFLLKKVNK